MKYNYLGHTGLLVSELCFGTMTFGGGNGGIWEAIGKVQQDGVNELMKTAVDNGINLSIQLTFTHSASLKPC